MGIYTYTFRAKKRKALLDGTPVDLHLMPFAYRGDGIPGGWFSETRKRDEALLMRRHDMAARAWEKSTSKLAVLADGFVEGEPVFKVDRSSWCDASSKEVGECVGFIRKVGRRILIEKKVNWHKDTAVAILDDGRREIWLRYWIEDGVMKEERKYGDLVA